MKKSKFSESQIVAILKEGESGVPVAQVLRQHGISQATYYNGKAKYGGASVAELKRLRELEAAKKAEQQRVDNVMKQLGLKP